MQRAGLARRLDRVLHLGQGGFEQRAHRLHLVGGGQHKDRAGRPGLELDGLVGHREGAEGVLDGAYQGVFEEVGVILGEGGSGTIFSMLVLQQWLRVELSAELLSNSRVAAVRGLTDRDCWHSAHTGCPHVQPPLSVCTRGQQSTVCQNRPLNWQRQAETRRRVDLEQGLKGGKSMLRKWTTRNKEIPILILAPDAKTRTEGCLSRANTTICRS